MSLDKIQLPDFILAELYKDSLVEIENLQEEKEKITVEPKPPVPDIEKPLTENKEKQSLKFLGQNKKNIVVVVDEAKALFINEAELDFLTKILTACNLNLADIAIVNIHDQQLTFQQLKEQLHAQYVLLLGIEPTVIRLPFSVPPFQVQPFADTTIFHTPALSAMLANTQESRLLKSKLWLSLKTAFNL
jgi:hypothetical protein